MLARSLAVAIAASMLVTGCQTTTKSFYVSPDKRPQTPKKCPNEDECKVAVDPSQWVWVTENIEVYKNKHVVFQLPRPWNWSEPPIVVKEGVNPDYFKCSKQGNDVKCKVGEHADVQNFGYTIRVQLTPDYDPFVWPK